MKTGKKFASRAIADGHARRLAAVVLLGLLAGGAAGCDSGNLETGYKYRPLNATDAERRAYYSGKYTKEAVKADQEREAEFRARRPGI